MTRTDNTNPNMTYHCNTCDKDYPISDLHINQDANVSFRVVFSGGRWHTTNFETDDVSLYDEIICVCGECNEEVDEPDVPGDFWWFSEEVPAWYKAAYPNTSLPSGVVGDDT